MTSRRANGSFSSRAGQSWSRGGADYRKRREDALLARTKAGHAGWLTSPSTEKIQAAIAAQLCPACGAGPYKVLAQHMNSAHGISGAELRKLAGVGSKASICSAQVAEQARVNFEQRPDREAMSRRGNQVATARGSTKIARRAWQQKNMRDTAERDELIARLYADGVLLQDIAQRVGIAANQIRRVLRRRGIDADVDGRARRFQDGAYRERVVSSLHTGWQRHSEAQRLQLIEEFKSLGSSVEAVKLLAERYNVGRQSMQQRLRSYGCNPPDARPAASKRRAKVSDEQRQELVALYQQGLSQSQVSARLGITQSHVSTILRSSGVPTRPFARSSRR